MPTMYELLQVGATLMMLLFVVVSWKRWPLA